MTSNKQQATSNKQQATSNKQQATSNKQQATSNKQQATSLNLFSSLIYLNIQKKIYQSKYIFVFYGVVCEK
ncbi:hypothetical protein OFS07_03270 [Brachyspira hyodysenteriae]|uniref:hypothetical protein n=1 Tax=Brachyspira hyodysenteriae TaxID=159 RepID=UPI00118266FA|nr:hypothetical protein [Brachyspira hyodysenteriae]MCZ9889457.1 hypothetical protein [Brachyspira hyodysenteriae]MCZ9939128.1 hypothetical protein [Brachyspira hyodysenteriae]MDA0023728.1 hypothetical protein [Brachyspira hyodysenteriae]MDA0063851.1 hypothetical protein [Brachyspira hyodysenteriae]MDA0065302.1 hypothetical protein [Brachyspira hyodysenteriae]